MRWMVATSRCLWFHLGMSEDKRVAESQGSAEMVKRSYASPTYSRLGSLGELTRTQTKGGIKNDPGGGLSKV